MAQAMRRVRTTTRRRGPVRDDPPVVQGASLTVMTAIRAYKAEAEAARRTRLRRNEDNWRAYLSEWDFSYKRKGQSRESLPKVAMAAEQLAAVFQRGLTEFGDWFAIDLGNQAHMAGLTDEQARTLLQRQLDGAHAGSFALTIADAVKSALLGSLLILKVYGVEETKRTFAAERGVSFTMGEDGQPLPTIGMQLMQGERQSWQLHIDAIPPEDYLPDPTGRTLYEIHTVERDLWEVQEMADAGIYDSRVVDQIRADFTRKEDEWRRMRERGRDDAPTPDFRKRVVLDECWGTLLTPEGRVAEKNIVATVANDHFLIRPPEPNPAWHGLSPFVVCPLVRVPFTVWHRALFDDAVALNQALNELYNLMLDGGIASVWGNKQVRPDFLFDPRSISDGIPPGMTLVVREGVPVGAKVLEQVATGQVPQDARLMYELTDREFQSASQVNAVKLGQLPPTNTTATAIVEAEQSAGLFFDMLIRQVEDHAIEPALYRAWCLYMQYLDQTDAAETEIVEAIGERGALQLARMSPAERYSTFAGAKVKVSGLSAVQARVREFQKLLALMSTVGQQPLLLQAFMKTASGPKILQRLFKALNIDPETLAPDDQERAEAPDTMQQLLTLMNPQAAQTPGTSAVRGQPPRGATPRLPSVEGGGGMPLPVERVPPVPG